MKKIFVNLKRFEVPRSKGGICPFDSPKRWVEWVIAESVKHGLGALDDVEVTFLLPEGLVIPALEKKAVYPEREVKALSIGCQGVYREDVTPGGNFGAFTTSLPAAAARNLGCQWSMVGHSEERRDKVGVIAGYDPATRESPALMVRAAQAVNGLINAELLCALKAGLKVLICVGETAAERGMGDFSTQKPRIEAVLRAQLTSGLSGIAGRNAAGEVVIGYEPIWAIGPGKTPPDSEYIDFVASYIKTVVRTEFAFDPVVVYGGGLKEENAEAIAGIGTIGGGLVALTRFTGEIAFEPESLSKIVEKYRNA